MAGSKRTSKAYMITERTDADGKQHVEKVLIGVVWPNAGFERQLGYTLQLNALPEDGLIYLDITDEAKAEAA
jgi:hypothetical protein